MNPIEKSVLRQNMCSPAMTIDLNAYYPYLKKYGYTSESVKPSFEPEQQEQEEKPEQESDEVTHEVFFGENIKRVLSILKK
jgi:hypothetical protein